MKRSLSYWQISVGDCRLRDATGIVVNVWFSCARSLRTLSPRSWNADPAPETRIAPALPFGWCLGRPGTALSPGPGARCPAISRLRGFPAISPEEEAVPGLWCGKTWRNPGQSQYLRVRQRKHLVKYSFAL